MKERRAGEREIKTIKETHYATSRNVVDSVDTGVLELI
jgi:hypothetical protein